MNPDKFYNNSRNKLLFTMSYLRGKALEWIQLYIENYINSTSQKDINTTTLAILGDVDTFFAAIEETFNVGNDILEADHDLRVLRQRTSATAYCTEFSILAAKIG
jgi:hypothetical protein